MGYSTALPYYASHSQAQMHYHPIERRIVRRIIRSLKKNGTPVTSIYDGEERTPVRTEREAMSVIFNLDWAMLCTDAGDWVRIDMGNKWESITDHTVDLENALAETEAWIAANDDDR